MGGEDGLSTCRQRVLIQLLKKGDVVGMEIQQIIGVIGIIAVIAVVAFMVGRFYEHEKGKS
jgi:hypothetical protein